MQFYVHRENIEVRMADLSTFSINDSKLILCIAYQESEKVEIDYE